MLMLSADKNTVWLEANSYLLGYTHVTYTTDRETTERHQVIPLSPLLVSFNCQVDTTKNHLGRPSMRGCLGQVSPRACIIGNALITLIDIERPSPLWGAPFPKGLCIVEEWRKWVVQTCVHPCSLCSWLCCDVDACIHVPSIFDCAEDRTHAHQGSTLPTKSHPNPCLLFILSCLVHLWGPDH